MAARNLGDVLIIANPAAHSGAGLEAARYAERLFDVYRGAASRVRLELTQGPGDGARLARASAGHDLVAVLGGDGIIHEAVNGLMALDAADRPTLALIPMGSGNDFARTLGMAFDDPDRSIAQLLSPSSSLRELDLIHASSDACEEGTYGCETLSFGLDAAIALDTTDRRAAGSRQKGAALFATSGVRIMAGAHQGWDYEADIDGERFEGNDIAFAVQNGPTYGGGFRICPDARPDDGLLDLCFTTRHPSTARSLATFALARGGHHTRSRWLTFRQAKHVGIRFGQEPPCQVDGERLRGRSFEIGVVPHALRVLAPAASEDGR